MKNPHAEIQWQKLSCGPQSQESMRPAGVSHTHASCTTPDMHLNRTFFHMHFCSNIYSELKVNNDMML